MVSCKECYDRGFIYEIVPGTEDDFIPDADEVYCQCEQGLRLKFRERKFDK